MGRLGIFGLVLALLMQVLSASLIVVNYRINRSYIIQNFCENTNRPELHCEGKCHLSKQIKADSEQKSETPASVSEILTIVMTCQELSTIEFNFRSGTPILTDSPYTVGHYSNHLQSVFHPPQV